MFPLPTKSILAILLVLMPLLPVCAQSEGREWGRWTAWGEQPGGTYLNPVIPADFSDIDCIRVGDEYYAISSTMQYSPGMTLLRSTDLVNWELCCNIIDDLTQIGPELNWDRMGRYGRGVWAGTLRHHAGRFYLFFGTPDEGYFMSSADKAEGPWSPLVCLLAEPGWDDCTAIWAGGKAYFLGTHFADGYKTYLFDMAADGTKIYRETARLVNEGGGREASKLIEHEGRFYLVFSRKSGRGRYVLAKRADSVTGPYSEERQIGRPDRAAREPNQGGIVEGRDGRWYFLTHHGTGDWGGRQVSLLPVTWTDGWPIIGEPQPEGGGAMVWSGRMPAADSVKLSIRRSDEFDSAVLPAQWQWNHQPRRDMYSLAERPGWLRLKAFRPLRRNALRYAGNTLTQRSFMTEGNVVTVRMDVAAMADGQHAGLCHLSSQSGAVGVSRAGGRARMEWRQNDSTVAGPVVCGRYVWLRSEWGLDGMSRFSYSLDGDRFVPFGAPYRMVWGNYRGDRVGLYNFNDEADEGAVDVDYFHYEWR